MSDNSATLLGQRHFGATNQWGKPVVGWQDTSEGFGLVNPMGFALQRIVHQSPKGEPLYDQPLLIENAGAIVLPTMGERIGLIQAWRINGERLLEAGADYVRRLQEENRWQELVESLGQWTWESPRGLSPEGVAGEDLLAHVVRTARLEAREEAGFEISNVEVMGRVNANTTFFAHPQYVVKAEVTSIGDKKPEDLEQGAIGATQFFTPAELRKLNRSGEFVCGLTMSAMNLCGLAMPV